MDADFRVTAHGIFIVICLYVVGNANKLRFISLSYFIQNVVSFRGIYVQC